MPAKARIGVIGTGWWATYAHIPTLKANPDVELVAISDIRSELLSKVGNRYEVGKTYTDFREMLSKEALDGVVIAVWHAAHFEVARACLEKNLHLLLEKPMVLKASHAKELCDLARERNREIIVGYPYHYLPQTLRSREVLNSGKLGEIHYISNVFSSSAYDLYRGIDHSDLPELAAYYPVAGPGDVYQDPERSGGGQGHLQVTHSAALMLFITGLKPISIQAQMDHMDVPVDVVDALIARLDNGSLATVGSTGATKGGDGRLDIQVYCKEGWIELAYFPGTGTIHFGDGSEEDLTPDPDTPDLNYRENPGYPAHLPSRNLVDVILGRAQNGSPSEIRWRTVELLDAAYRSFAIEGREVKVDTLY